MKAIDDEIVPRGGEMTVLELVKKYLLQKREYGITPKQIIICSQYYQERGLW